MNSRVLWSTFLTFVCMFLSTHQCVSGSTSISSFFFTSWDTKSSSWVKDTDIFPGDNVRLECTTTEDSQFNKIRIIRADQSRLSIHGTDDIQNDDQSLVVTLRSVGCSQMGTYVCENGGTENKTVDFGIYGCPPQPCKDQSTDITLYASVNETKQFSVCVEAFPDVSSFDFSNEKDLQFDSTNENSGVSCAKNKTEDVFSTYISCQIKFGGEINYGVLDFSISSRSSDTAQNQKVSFAIRMEEPGPPDCPTGINSTNQESDSVTLSWQPVNNRGGSQPVTYAIFYTTDDDTEWLKYSSEEGGSTQAVISNLESDSLYQFRVASANEYRQDLDENTCNETVEARTKTGTTTTTSSRYFTNKPEPDNVADDAKEVLSPIVIIIILAIIVIVAVVTGMVVCIKIRKVFTGVSRFSAPSATMAYHTGQRSNEGQSVTVRCIEDSDRGAASPHQGSSGRYISPEGLTYVTIDHSNSKPNSGRRKSEKVLYSTLDPVKSGKYTASEIPSDKEYENIILT